jgi:hypothetical protein
LALNDKGYNLDQKGSDETWQKSYQALKKALIVYLSVLTGRYSKMVSWRNYAAGSTTKNLLLKESARRPPRSAVPPEAHGLSGVQLLAPVR